MNKFEDTIPRMCGFEKGDVFTLDSDYQVFIQRIPTKEIYVQYTTVVNQFGEVRNLYPSQLLRKVEDENGKIVRASGSAVEMFKSFRNINDGMNALIGKKIQVSEVRFVLTKSGKRQKVFDFDFV